MNKTTKTLSLVLAGMSLIGASQLSAAPVNVTIADYNSTLWGFSGAGSLSGGGYSNQGNFGAAKEDNETEGGTIAGQQWDMEAFVVNGSTLSIVAGFDLLNGNVPHDIGAGDLFIKIGGSQPTPNPTNPGASNVTNSIYNYTYAIDLSKPAKHGNASFGSSASVYSLNGATVLNTVIYDQFGSNPWKYSSGAAGTSAAGITYVTGQANNSAALQALGLGWLAGGYHNILTIDLSFLVGNVAPGTPVYFSYTMECGNDSLKGSYAGGFDRVPDGVASALLIALGMAGMAAYGIRRRKL